MVKLGIANTIAQSNATSQPISSAVSVAMLVIWLEIVRIVNVVLIGVMMVLAALEVVHRLAEPLAKVMPSTENTTYVSFCHLWCR